MGSMMIMADEWRYGRERILLKDTEEIGRLD